MRIRSRGRFGTRKCPQCGCPGSKFIKDDGSEKVWAAEHVIGVGQGVPQDIYDGLKANFEGECTEVGMYLAMARAAHREGYPESVFTGKRQPMKKQSMLQNSAKCSANSSAPPQK